MNTLINIVFVSTVALHSAADKRSRKNVSYYMCEQIQLSLVSFDHKTQHALKKHVTGNKDTHQWFMVQETRARTTKCQPHNQKMAMFDKYHVMGVIHDKSMRYHKYLSTCNNNKK